MTKADMDQTEKRWSEEETSCPPALCFTDGAATPKPKLEPLQNGSAGQRKDPPPRGSPSLDAADRHPEPLVMDNAVSEHCSSPSPLSSALPPSSSSSSTLAGPGASSSQQGRRKRTRPEDFSQQTSSDEEEGPTHSRLKYIPVDCSQTGVKSLQSQQTPMSKATQVDELALKCSYEVALLIARTKQPYTVGEELILPSVVAMGEALCWNDADINKMRTIPVSETTVAHCIYEMAADVQVQLAERLKLADAFALQLDWSTDATMDAQLLAFVRFVDGNEIQEEFLFCSHLPEDITNTEIFNVIDVFFSENDIPWAKCTALCTDRSRAAASLRNGLVELVKDVAPQVIWTHCMINRESLVHRFMSAELSNVMKSLVEVIRLLKESPLHTSLFSELCAEEAEEHNALLYFSEVRWLCRGAALSRVLKLRTSILEFLSLQKHTPLISLFSDNMWITKLAYLTDLFAELEKLNGSIPGANTHIIQLYDRIEGFIKTIRRWMECIRKGVYSMFPSVDELGGSAVLSPAVTRTILAHLTMLEGQFMYYVLKADSWRRKDTWIQFPFRGNAAEGAGLTRTEEDQLTLLYADRTLRKTYATQPLTHFWTCCHKDFPQLAARAMRSLLPFATTGLCENAFSLLCHLRKEYWSRQHPEADVTLCLTTSIHPRVDDLCATRQSETSN